ncbi:MAG: glycosyltransferase family 39 protein [Pseudomonadota bacterium]
MNALLRALLALALLVPWLGFAGFPLFDLDEGAFTASTTEMFLRGDWLSTWLNGAPRHDKPVLAYWLQAAGASLAGFTEAGFRLPSVLAGSAWVFLTWAFTARQAGPRAGVLAAVMVAASLGPLLIAKAATADALLNLFLAAAGYAAWLWLDSRERRWLWLCWAAMALGFLTKGPVAVLVPAGTVLACLALDRDWRRMGDFLGDWRAWALFLAIAAPWFALLTLRDGLGFLAGFFLKHNLGRFSAPMEGHGGSPFYYLPVLFLSLLPFSGLLFSLAGRLGEAWRTPWLRFGLVWFLLVLLLFSASGTKLPHYLYYGYGGLIPALAWAALATRRPGLLLLPALLAGLAVFFLPDLLLAFGDRVKAEYAPALATLDQYFGNLFRLALGLAVVVAAGLILARRPGAPERLGLAGLALAGAVSLALLPAAGGLLQGPVRAAGQAARQLDGPLVMVGLNTPSFQTYAGRLVARRPPRSGDLVLVPTRRLDSLPPRLQTWDFGAVSLARIR